MWQLLCENIFIATVKEESLTQPPLLLCNLSKAREESFIWVKFLCKAPCESAHWGCAARAGGCTESQVSVSPKVWFNFFINYLGDRAGTILIQWAADRHQGGAAVTSEDWLGIQHGLIKSERVSGKKKSKRRLVRGKHSNSVGKSAVEIQMGCEQSRSKHMEEYNELSLDNSFSLPFVKAQGNSSSMWKLL